MQRYKLNKLAKRGKGARVSLPPITERAGSVLEYRTALRRILAEQAREVRETVIPAYRSELQFKRLVQDDNSWFERLRALKTSLEAVVADTVERIIGLEAKRHTKTFRNAVKRALGIDLGAVVRDEDLEDYLRAAVSRNVSLIRGLNDDLAKRIELTVYNAKISGRSVEQLRKALQKDFKVAKNRADLIAQDQMAKVTADLNEIRQTQASVASYSWLTSKDERVRARHASIGGTVYKWGQPTGAEEGLPPGKPIRCRCTAVGIVEF